MISQDKGAKKVFDKLCDEFGSTPRHRERVVRLDPFAAGSLPADTAAALLVERPLLVAPGFGVGAGAAGLPTALGLEDLDVALRDCVKSSFQARQSAYMDEVPREKEGLWAACQSSALRALCICSEWSFVSPSSD